MTDGWNESADSWIASQGDEGDFGRRYVLDGPMTARVAALAPATALDVGCGEGRFCRVMQGMGVSTVGVDPTVALIERARNRDPAGDYRVGRVEALEFEDGVFDLVVSYLTMIDFPDLAAAVKEMARVLRPGGRLLIANLTSLNTAGLGDERLGSSYDAQGRYSYAVDGYLDERAHWVEWSGIRIVNWHRPLETYMSLLLEADLTLTHFAEPAPTGGDPATVDRYRRAPWFHVMEWRK